MQCSVAVPLRCMCAQAVRTQDLGALPSVAAGSSQAEQFSLFTFTNHVRFIIRLLILLLYLGYHT